MIQFPAAKAAAGGAMEEQAVAEAVAPGRLVVMAAASILATLYDPVQPAETSSARFG